MVHTFSASSRRKHHIGGWLPGLTLGAALVLGGCASVPPPDTAMNQAQMQLQAARDAGGADYAPVDLGFAQGKFQQAQAAMAAKDFAQAARLAEESHADAEVARAKARLGNARAQIQAKTEENARLRQRMEASAGATGARVDPGQGSGASTVLQDMPAPSASVLSAPLPAQPAAMPQGFEPAPAASSGGVPLQPTDGGRP